MNKAAVIGNLVLIALMLVVQWAVFMPLKFISVVTLTIADAFNNLVENGKATLKTVNDELLKEAE